MWAIVATVEAFVNETPPTFKVAVEELTLPRALTVDTPLAAGSVARMKTTRLNNKLVRVLGLHVEWDTRAVAASLQTEA